MIDQAERTPTPEQAAAISSNAKRRVLIAHPGTGKTFTLVEIIADLLTRRKRDPECITALSFTRNAAAELKERAVQRVGGRAFGITFGTSHSLALKIVRSRARDLGYPSPEVTVYDEQDQRDVMKDTIETLKSDMGIEAALELLAEIRSGEPGEWPAARVRVIREYESRLKKACAIDLSAIIPLALTVLRTDARARSEWSRTARYLIVDEYHDTAGEEAALYRALDPVEVVIVGDPNQEIYAFRGTSNRYLLFAAQEEGTAVFYLTQSFRSGTAVVNAANALISHNPPQPEDKLRAAHEGGSVEVVTSMSFDSQALCLKEFAAEALGKGLSCAVLARTNRELGHVVRALRAGGVPVSELSLPREFYAAEEVRAFHAALRCVFNPFDEIAATMVCRTWPGMPRPKSPEWFAGREKANAEDIALLEALGWARNWIGYGEDEAILGRVAMECAAKIGSTYAADGRATRAQNVGEALARVLRWIELWGDSLEGFIDWLQHREIRDALRDARQGPAIECGTIHAAKGLEWDNVAIAGVHETAMPIGSADVEEERRLAYVAVTRARRVLRLFYCLETDCEVSRFVAEMGV